MASWWPCHRGPTERCREAGIQLPLTGPAEPPRGYFHALGGPLKRGSSNRVWGRYKAGLAPILLRTIWLFLQLGGPLCVLIIRALFGVCSRAFDF